MIEVNEITKRTDTDTETETETEKRQKWRLLKIDKGIESRAEYRVQEGEPHNRDAMN